MTWLEAWNAVIAPRLRKPRPAPPREPVKPLPIDLPDEFGETM